MKITTIETAPVLENPLGLDARIAASAEEAELVIFNLNPGEKIPAHPMSVRVFFMILNGAGEITVGNKKEQISVNQVVEVEPTILRSWKNNEKSPLKVLAIKTPRPDES